MPHISLVFGEMWDTKGLPLKPAKGTTKLHSETVVPFCSIPVTERVGYANLTFHFYAENGFAWWGNVRNLARLRQ
jgi:hypothetical protein